MEKQTKPYATDVSTSARDNEPEFDAMSESVNSKSTVIGPDPEWNERILEISHTYSKDNNSIFAEHDQEADDQVADSKSRAEILEKIRIRINARSESVEQNISETWY